MAEGDFERPLLSLISSQKVRSVARSLSGRFGSGLRGSQHLGCYITLGLSEKQQSDLKAKYGKKGPVYGSGNRIDLIAWDIAVHFKTNFKDLDLGLKGQIATDSKLSAIRYKKALDATGLVSSAIVI